MSISRHSSELFSQSTSVVNKMTTFQAITNMINSSVGIGVLAKPYAFAIAGYQATFCIIVACIIMNYCGSLLAWVSVKYSTKKSLISPHISPFRNISNNNTNSIITIPQKRNLNNYGNIPQPNNDKTDKIAKINENQQTSEIDKNHKHRLHSNDNDMGAGNSLNYDYNLNNTENIMYGSVDCADCDISDIINQNPTIYNYDSNDNKKRGTTMRSAYSMIAYKTLGTYGAAYASISVTVVLSTVLITSLLMNMQLTCDVFNEIFYNLTDISQNTTNSDSNHSLTSNIVYYLTNSTFIYCLIVVLTFPTAMILQWKHITIVGYIGVLSLVSMTLLMIALCVDSAVQFGGPPPKHFFIPNNPNNKHSTHNTRHSEVGSDSSGDSTDIAINMIDKLTNFQIIITSFVLFVMGISGNSAIPMIVHDLEKQTTKIATFVVWASYTFVAIFYLFIGIMGYWLYGEYTNVVILNNFFQWPGGWVVTIVTVLVIVNIWSSSTIIMSVVGQQIERQMKVKDERFTLRRIIRGSIYSFLVVIGYGLMNHLAFMVAMGGAIAVLAGIFMTLPILMYLCDEYSNISIVSKLLHIILIVLSVAIGAFVFYTDVKQIY